MTDLKTEFRWLFCWFTHD